MESNLIYGLNEFGLFIITIILFALSSEIGFRLGRRSGRGAGREANTPPQSDNTRGNADTSHVETIEGALLGLLALLLGFAFSMAMARYDARRAVVLAETNDLQTTYLRAGLLPESRQVEVKRLLTQYVDSRVAFLQAGADQKALENAKTWTIQLQKQLWNQAQMAVKENSDEVVTGYFVESLNGLIDDHTRRLSAMESHVPEVILLLLIFVGTMTLAMSGFSSGLHRRRLLIPRFILISLVAATLTVIVDLDRPRRGLIKVSEKVMLELQSELKAESGQSGRMN